MIADGRRIGEIRDYIADGRDQYGMQTFDQHLTDLVQEGEVTFETAMAAATNPSDFELKMRMFRHVSSTPREASPTPAEAGVGAGSPSPSNGMEGISQGGSGAFDFLGS
jgi:twitching motility protein PilT